MNSVLSTFFGVYVLEHELPPFSLSLIQWRTKPVVVMKQIGSSVIFSSEHYFQVASSGLDTCWHFQHFLPLVIINNEKKTGNG